jgi:hypothetical protein
MKNSAHGDSSTRSELKAVEEACRRLLERSNHAYSVASAVNSVFPILVAARQRDDLDGECRAYFTAASVCSMLPKSRATPAKSPARALSA